MTESNFLPTATCRTSRRPPLPEVNFPNFKQTDKDPRSPAAPGGAQWGGGERRITNEILSLRPCCRPSPCTPLSVGRLERMTGRLVEGNPDQRLADHLAASQGKRKMRSPPSTDFKRRAGGAVMNAGAVPQRRHLGAALRRINLCLQIPSPPPLTLLPHPSK